MANKSTADVILAIRQHSNTVNRKVVTDSEVLARANEGLWSLYDMIDGAHGTYFVIPHDFTLVGGNGQNTAPLPSDFYRAKALDLVLSGGELRSVPQLPSFAERNNPRERSYDLEDVSNIMVVPPATAGGSYRLRYIPKCPQLGTPVVIASANPPIPAARPLVPVPDILTPPVILTGNLHGDVSSNQRDLCLQVKNQLVTAGMYVVQSYNANGVLPAPGVDTWVAYTDIKGASGGGGTGGSWIVLGNHINPMQLCLFATVSGGWLEWQIAVGPAGGFTGGTTTARPTATLEANDNGVSTYPEFLGTGPAGNPQFYAIVWTSPDFSVTRIGWCYGGKLKSLWQFDQLQNVPTGWTKNYIHCQFHWGNTDYTIAGNSPTTDLFTKNWGSAGSFKRAVLPSPDTTIDVDGSLRGSPAGTLYVPDQAPNANRLSGQKIIVGTLGYIQTSSGGYWGNVRDMYFTTTGFNHGDTAGDNFDWIIFGQLMLPWGTGAVGARLGGSSTNYPTADWLQAA